MNKKRKIMHCYDARAGGLWQQDLQNFKESRNISKITVITMAERTKLL